MMKSMDKIGYYCSTRISAFIPMLLSGVIVIILSAYGVVKYFMQSVKPVENEMLVYGLFLSVFLISTLYYAYRYIKPVKEFRYIVLNNFTGRLYVRNRVVCWLYLFVLYVLMIMLLLLVVYTTKYGLSGFVNVFADIILRLVAIPFVLGAFLSLNVYNNYYSYYSGKLQ